MYLDYADQSELLLLDNVIAYVYFNGFFSVWQSSIIVIYKGVKVQ